MEYWMVLKINSVKKVKFQTITTVKTDECDSSVAGCRGFTTILLSKYW